MKIRRIIATALTALVMGTIGALAVSTPASAETVGPFRIVHNYSNLCVEVPGGTHTWYTQVQLGPCDYYAYQTYHLVETGNPWQFYIRAYQYLCLDVGSWSQAPDAPIVQWLCTGTPNQRFLAVSIEPGVWKLQAEHSGMCLRVNSAYVGAGVVQGYCNDINALWRFVTVA